MTAFQQTRREGGFTLLELLLVIGVAALLLIGGIATYRLVSDGNKTTEATRLLLTLRQEANQLAQQNGGTYTGINYTTTPAVTASNIFVAAGILRISQRNPFNGNITIAPDAANPAELDITFANVPKSGCVKMYTAITSPNEITSVSAGTSGNVTKLSDSSGTNQLTATNAATDCATTNTMVWQVK